MWEGIVGVWDNGRYKTGFIDMGPLSEDSSFNMNAWTKKKVSKVLMVG